MGIGLAPMLGFIALLRQNLKLGLGGLSPIEYRMQAAAAPA